MMISETPSDHQKSMFRFSIAGKRRKKSSDGITSQKIPWDKPAIFAVSFVSMYIHTKANKETIGIEAKILPANVLRLDISEIATIVTDESNTLIM
jgi:hypothetical protein